MTTNDIAQPPQPDELEISLFGPGFGEALALHLGQGAWLLVDSCTTPDASDPLSLRYLRAMGIDPSTAVKLIVVSHWHDDHVRGISTLVEVCRSASVAVSEALRSDEFSTLASVYAGAAIPEGSGINELARVLNTLHARRPHGARFGAPLLCSVDRRLFHLPGKPGSSHPDASIYSLSPSDASSLQSRLAFHSLIPSPGSPTRPIAFPTQNHSSVVILVEVPPDRILLGADLEATADPTRGWADIIDRSAVAHSPAQAFKVPHHGSHTSHDDRIWSVLLTPEPIALLSPFLRGAQVLPTPQDISRIRSSTPNAYITSVPAYRKYRPRERVVQELVSGATRSIRTIQSGFGHIRLRKPVGEPAGAWRIDLFGAARPLA